jgi:RNA recognition motif-containing protein
MQNKLFVRNLSFDTENSELRKLFRNFGNVLSVRIPVDRQTGRSRGFGFVEMSTSQAAADAMKALNSQQISGRRIQVSFSEQRDQRSTAYGIY